MSIRTNSKFFLCLKLYSRKINEERENETHKRQTEEPEEKNKLGGQEQEDEHKEQP